MDDLKQIESGKNTSNDVDFYRQRKARNVTISVMLYILSVVALITISCLPGLFGTGDFGEDKNAIVGVVIMLTMDAVATGLLVYTKLSAPASVDAQLKEETKARKMIAFTTNNKKAAAFVRAMWPFVLVIYLGVSFLTGAWHITWIIWLIGAAVRNAIYAFTNTDPEENKNA